MKVELIAHTGLPERIVACSARGCYSNKSSDQLLKTLSPEEIDRTLGLTHGSTYEHVTFTFSVEGVSRVLTHQLVRHRVGTAFSQQSMRYVDVHKLWDHIVVPPKIQEIIDEEIALGMTYSDSDMLHAIQNFKDSLAELMDEMDKHKIPSEDQRYFVPNGVKSNITVTMNARELQHFCGLRRCNRAQWEIRELADKMAELVEEICPALCQHLDLGPQCVQLGYCPEHKGCGRFPTISKIMNYAIKGKLVDWSLDIDTPGKKEEKE